MQKHNNVWTRTVTLLLTSAAVVVTLSYCNKSGSQIHPARITPDAYQSYPSWTAEEKAKDVALRPVAATKDASYHYVHVRTAERSHIHKEHDTFVVIVSGRGVMHFGDKAFPVQPGDSVEIPRMVPHWVENKDPAGTTGFVIFSPPFDGKDRHFLEK